MNWPQSYSTHSVWWHQHHHKWTNGSGPLYAKCSMQSHLVCRVQIKSGFGGTSVSSWGRSWWDCGGKWADRMRRARGWRRESWRLCCFCWLPGSPPPRSRWRTPGPGTRTGGADPWSWSLGRWCCGAAWRTQRPRPASRGWCAWGTRGRWWLSGRCRPDNARTRGPRYFLQSLDGGEKKGGEEEKKVRIAANNQNNSIKLHY